MQNRFDSSYGIQLCRARVLYVGNEVPIETSRGLDAFQYPLRKIYPKCKPNGKALGVEGTLSVFSSGLQYQRSSKGSPTLWFPIQTLHACAAVRVSSNHRNGLLFVPIDTEDGRNTRHPPIFASIMRRSNGLKVLECHVFICKSDKGAKGLVHSVVHASKHKEGWNFLNPRDQIAEDEMTYNVTNLNGHPSSAVQTYNNATTSKNYDNSRSFAQNYSSNPVQNNYQQSNQTSPDLFARATVRNSYRDSEAVNVTPSSGAKTFARAAVLPDYFFNWNDNGGQTYMFNKDSPLSPQQQHLRNMNQQPLQPNSHRSQLEAQFRELELRAQSARGPKSLGYVTENRLPDSRAFQQVQMAYNRRQGYSSERGQPKYEYSENPSTKYANVQQSPDFDDFVIYAPQSMRSQRGAPVGQPSTQDYDEYVRNRNSGHPQRRTMESIAEEMSREPIYTNYQPPRNEAGINNQTAPDCFPVDEPVYSGYDKRIPVAATTDLERRGPAMGNRNTNRVSGYGRFTDDLGYLP